MSLPIWKNVLGLPLMYRVIIDSKAEQDLFDIFLYITETLNATDAAEQLYSKIKKKLSNLSSMPHRCPLISTEPYKSLGVRKLFIENYIAFFLINETSREIHVFRILYNRQQWNRLI